MAGRQNYAGRSQGGHATERHLGWASDPASTIGMEFLRGLPSAAAALIGRGVSFPQVPGIVRLPRQVAGPISAPWVQEGAPIRVASDGVDTILLPEPKKLGVILALTRELYKKPAARAVTDALLRESAAKSIDAAYFSADAASDAGHAGLLWDATDLGVGTNLVEDLELAARSVASGLAPVLFISSPGRREQAVISLPDIAPNVIACPLLQTTLWLPSTRAPCALEWRAGHQRKPRGDRAHGRQ